MILGAAHDRWQFPGYSRSQEAGKARVAGLKIVELVAAWLPMSAIRRQLFIKDVKVFLRDVSQWLQLLPLVALVLLYLYNFRAIDLNRIPYMSGVLKNAYAFLNLGLAGFVLATVAVRFVFPAVSAEGFAFWIVRVSPVSFRDFLWSKFWIGLVPIFILIEGLTITANQLLGIDPFLKAVCASGMVFMTFALVGLAVGLGARYPRFGADVNQVAGSYGGVAFMVLAVLYIIVTIAALGWASAGAVPAGQPAAPDDLRSRPHRHRVRRRERDQRRHLAAVDEVGGQGVGEDAGVVGEAEDEELKLLSSSVPKFSLYFFNPTFTSAAFISFSVMSSTIVVLPTLVGSTKLSRPATIFLSCCIASMISRVVMSAIGGRGPSFAMRSASAARSSAESAPRMMPSSAGTSIPYATASPWR